MTIILGWNEELTAQGMPFQSLPIVAVRDPWLLSVRISSWAQYNTGLFILDLDKVPWGCGELQLYLLYIYLTLGWYL